MATTKQIAANRRNAQKSTGPKTGAGKKIVSRNAVKFGLLAKHVIVLPGEEAEYARYAEGFREEQGPEGTLEDILVLKMIDSQWLLMRSRKVESGILIDAMVKMEQTAMADPADSSELEATLDQQNPDALRLGRAYVRSHALSRIERSRVMLEREFYKALDEFQKLRYARVSLWEPFYIKNLKKFTPTPADSKKADLTAGSFAANENE